VFNSIVRKIQGVTPSAFFLTLVDDADAATARATLGVSGGATLVDFKESVRVATTGAGTLATSFENGDTIDGVVIATGNRILIKDQATAADNGIYIVAASGAPTRATDFDADAEVTAGCVIPVAEGTTNADKLFILTTNDPITVGVTGLAFSQLTASGAASWSALTDPSGNLTLAMATHLTSLVWAGNFSTSSAFKLEGNNTSATGPLLHLKTNTSNLIPPLLVECRGASQRLKVGHLGDVVLGQGGIGATDTDGWVYVPAVGSNAMPSGTPTGQTGFAPICAYNNGANGEYDLAIYLNSRWIAVGGARRRIDTGSGNGNQTLDFNQCQGANVTRIFTASGGNVTFTAWNNPPPNGSLVTVIIVQDGTGSRTVTWPASVKWSGGTAPTLTTTASKRDAFVFLWDGSFYWSVAQTLNL
jgi:hypothetical protein